MNESYCFSQIDLGYLIEYRISHQELHRIVYTFCGIRRQPFYRVYFPENVDGLTFNFINFMTFISILVS